MQPASCVSVKCEPNNFRVTSCDLVICELWATIQPFSELRAAILLSDCEYPLGKYMFVEYSWSNSMIYSRNIQKKFPMKFQGNIPK